MRTIFVDAGYWIALLYRQDALHAKAVSLARLLRGNRFVTTDLVLVEVLNFFAERGPYLRENAVKLTNTIHGASRIRVVSLGMVDFDRALELYRNRGDKGWSLTDCASFLVMDSDHIDEALTPDRHFEQAGYTALLR